MIVNTNEVLKRANDVTEAMENPEDYEWMKIERERKIIELLLLASIAQSLDNLVKNGVVVEQTK